MSNRQNRIARKTAVRNGDTSARFTRPAKPEPERHHESKSDRQQRERAERQQREQALAELED